MSDEQKEILFDLLTKKAIFGLDYGEQSQLDDLDPGTAEMEFQSLEMAAAAISLVGFADEEPLPAHLFAKIVASADTLVGAAQSPATPWPPAYRDVEEKPARSWSGLLGWAVAAAACVALAVNIWVGRSQPPVEVAKAPSVEIPKILTPAEMREAMLSSTSELVKANWAAGNVKELKDISGDIVWSDEKQSGYMRLRGLPVNEVTKETYQLWIFDKTQDKATPIDGGTFDVAAGGDVIIPINSKLKALEPGMFAITVEKPGGVVVSKREKIAALATVNPKIS